VNNNNLSLIFVIPKLQNKIFQYIKKKSCVKIQNLIIQNKEEKLLKNRIKLESKTLQKKFLKMIKMWFIL